MYQILQVSQGFEEVMTDKDGLFKLQIDYVILCIKREYIKYKYYFKYNPLFGISTKLINNIYY